MDAKQISKKALSYIDKYNLEPTPEIYSVWFEYFAEYIIQLKKDIDNIIKNSGEITKEEVLEIFNKYFMGEFGKKFKLFLEEIKLLINQILKHTNESSAIFEKGSENIKKFKDKISTNISKEELTEIAEKLLEHIEYLEKKEKTFAINLKESSEKFESLHNKIVQLEKQAKYDELTGLLNRRGFKEELEKAFQDNNITEISVIFSDIDNFKNINDTYGHFIGDEVLKFVATIFKKNLKGKDLICRWGGEEFVIILFNTPFDYVVKIAENLREQIARKRLILKKTGEKLHPVTASFGVAKQHNNETIEATIERADKLTYYSKTHGKNRVTHEKMNIERD